MKKQYFTSLYTLLFGCALLTSGSLSLHPATIETQTIQGPAITTDNMHNTEIGGPYDPNVYGRFANSWFKRYTLTVTAPSGWHFTGEPYVNCIKDDQGAFGWNNFPAAKDRFFVTEKSPSRIVATCWAGSRSIVINLACQATKD